MYKRRVRTQINFLTEIFRDPRLGIFALAKPNKNIPAPADKAKNLSHERFYVLVRPLGLEPRTPEV